VGIAMLFMFTIGAFFSQGIAFFDPVYTTIMSDFEYTLSLIAVILSVSCFLLLVHRYYTIKINWAFFSIAVTLALCNAIALLAFPSVYTTTGMDNHYNTYPITYLLTDSERTRSIITFAVTCLYLYIVFAIVPKVLRNSRQLTIYFYGAVILVIVAIVWSFIYEKDIYMYYFNPDENPTSSTVVESFFNNRNSFGSMILLGVCCCGYLQCQSRHWWHYLLMGVFSLELFFVISKTSMYLVAAYLVIFLIYRYVVTVRRHWLKDNIALAVILGMTGLGTWAVASGAIMQVPLLGKITKNVMDTIVDTGTDTIESRVIIWRLCLQELNSPFRIIFGLGEDNFLWLIGLMVNSGVDGFGFTHNGILAMLDYGGVVRLAAYIGMLMYFLILVIKNFRHKHVTTFATLLTFLMFLIHGMVETTAFMESDTKGLGLLIMIFLPVLTDHYQDKHPEISASQAETYASYQKDKTVYALTASEAARFSLFIASPIFLVFIAFYPSTALLNTPWILLSVLLFYVLIPLYAVCWSGLASLQKRGAHIMTLIACGLYLLGCLGLPLLLRNAIGFVVSGACQLLLLLILHGLSHHGIDQGHECVFLDAYVPFFSITLGLADCILGLQFLGNVVTPYAILCYAVIGVLIYILIVSASPASSFFTYPLNEQWGSFERDVLYHDMKWENKLDWKYQVYRSPKTSKKRGA
jgi:hypothetical protein